MSAPNEKNPKSENDDQEVDDPRTMLIRCRSLINSTLKPPTDADLLDFDRAIRKYEKRGMDPTRSPLKDLLEIRARYMKRTKDLVAEAARKKKTLDLYDRQRKSATESGNPPIARIIQPTKRRDSGERK